MRTVNFDGTEIAPSKIICVGRNYVAHIEELGNEVPEQMVVFGKPNSAISDQLHASLGGEPLHYEGEIALLIEAGRPVAAGFGLDLTKRELQAKLKDRGLPWERAKAFDGAALFSPFTAIDTPEALSLQLLVNGQLRQSGGVELMMYPPDEILAQLREFTSLEDGDIVMTGTPAGVGRVNAGDSFTGRVLQGSRILAERSWHAS
ncbi:FAA hydrolase family protein [Seongchinamella sediminis]|uniref:FAA hydrolase family protein n=1 Tax=Seongchinamella sediminis TaxID=2283635 RepID=A0A3L7E114_9GAMM|nr:fumarylacetoacetate hydrolase family protein [Seongchinamella sediminis]RLQ21812.1 FAA hydrolase family protein [Seongchinamella sediminis]